MTKAIQPIAHKPPSWGAIVLAAAALVAYSVSGFGTDTPVTSMSGAGKATANPSSQHLDPKDAEAKAQSGKYHLHVGKIADAQSECSQALAAAPANQTAKECLAIAASMAVDEQLNQADSLISEGNRAAAVPIAAVVAHSPVSDQQRKRAKIILAIAQPSAPARAWAASGEWIRQAVVTVLLILLATIIVRAARGTLNSFRKNKRFRRKTIWNMQPLEGPPASTDGQTATDSLLDALSRLGDRLDRPTWQPKLLLLRPTPPADYDPAVITDFLSNKSNPRLAPIVLSPVLSELRLEWNFHEVRLDEAANNLQLKTAAGIDVGSVLRFLIALGKWINSGTPTISGLVERTGTTATPPVSPIQVGSTLASPDVVSERPDSTDSAETISIHLAARGVGVATVSIITSNLIHQGIDCVQLAAERAAFKFLVRIKYPEMTNEEVSGLAAMRQGVALFSEFAGTIPAGGSAAATRTSSLKSAAHNLAFFRTSIPVLCGILDANQPAAMKSTNPGGKSVPDQKYSSQPASIKISDEIRQALLLAEGVANALSHDKDAQNAAISCFRQLEEWPGSEETLTLRQQAAYNEAIVQRAMGYCGQSVLMLTELLGEDVPGADGKTTAYIPGKSHRKDPLPEAIQFPARLARLAALAQYSGDDWAILPNERAELIIDDARKLIDDLDKLDKAVDRPALSLHDARLAKYFKAEAMRAGGHVELQRAIKILAERPNSPDPNQPANLCKDSLDEASPEDKPMIENLTRAIAWMRECEQLSPSCGLYCDIAESYLLLNKFPGAQAYARHATLQASPCENPSSPGGDAADDDPCLERAFYLAAKSYMCADNREIGKQYAMRYKGKVRLGEFKALRTALGIAPDN